MYVLKSVLSNVPYNKSWTAPRNKRSLFETLSVLGHVAGTQRKILAPILNSDFSFTVSDIPFLIFRLGIALPSKLKPHHFLQTNEVCSVALPKKH